MDTMAQLLSRHGCKSASTIFLAICEIAESNSSKVMPTHAKIIEVCGIRDRHTLGACLKGLHEAGWIDYERKPGSKRRHFTQVLRMTILKEFGNFPGLDTRRKENAGKATDLRQRNGGKTPQVASRKGGISTTPEARKGGKTPQDSSLREEGVRSHATPSLPSKVSPQSPTASPLGSSLGTAESHRKLCDEYGVDSGPDTVPELSEKDAARYALLKKSREPSPERTAAIARRRAKMEPRK